MTGPKGAGQAVGLLNLSHTIVCLMALVAVAALLTNVLPYLLALRCPAAAAALQQATIDCRKATGRYGILPTIAQLVGGHAGHGDAPAPGMASDQTSRQRRKSQVPDGADDNDAGGQDQGQAPKRRKSGPAAKGCPRNSGDLTNVVL